MRPKSLILLALALGCGLIASIGISQVLESRRHQRDATAEQTDILVALEDIERNAEFSDKNVAMKPWPKNQVPDGAITKIEDVVGRRPNTRIFKAEPILKGKLGTGEGSTRAAIDIPPGYGTMAVRMDSAQNSGLILPGDRVDVQVFINKGPNLPTATAITFLRDISVFAVNSEIRVDPNTEAKMDAKTVSLLVTPKQAAKLTLASEVGTIRLFLRGTTSATDNEDDIKVDLSDFTGAPAEDGSNAGSSAGFSPELTKFLNKQPVNHVAAAPPAEANDDIYKMVIMHGDNAHVEELHKGELLPRKLDAAPATDEPSATSSDAPGVALPSDTPASRPNTLRPSSPTSPTTVPVPPSSKDGALHRVAPAE